MGMSKGYKTNISIVNQKIGPERRQQILDGIANKGTFLPRGVLEEDMDQTFVEFLEDNKGLSISIDGRKLPVFFLTIQRWSEFTKTWKISGQYKDTEMPFITVVRKPDIQQGQNQAGLWNIPVDRTYVYYKVPTFDGIREGIDLYKVPQPTSVDITYEVRIFTNRMKDLNKFNRKIQRAFKSRQCYINPNGHPMPLHLESIGDESNIEDFENRRFYIQMYEMKLLGYILDEEDFEVVPTLNRTLITTEITDDEKNTNSIAFYPNIEGSGATYTFDFLPRSSSQYNFTSQYNLSFTSLNNIKDIRRIIVSVNNISIFDGTVITTPILINANDLVTIQVYKNRFSTGSFKLIGDVL